MFIPLLDRSAPEGAKAYARDKAPARFGFLDHHLAGRDYLLDRFMKADTDLGDRARPGRASGIDFAKWPAVLAYFKRMLERPSVAKALAEEVALFNEEQARRAA